MSAAAPWPRAAWLLIATLLLLGSVLAAVTIGPADISTLDVWRSIAMHLGLPLEAGLTPLRDSIVWDSRLPRVLAAGIVGAGLALSGAVVQAVTRNPLADPYLLGLSAGAALGAVTMIMIGAPLLLTPGAFVGALAALALTLAFARAIGGLTPSKAILSGIAVSALAAALTSLVIFWTATGDSYREILSWLLGSLAGAGWLEAAIAAAALVVVAPFIFLSARAMDAFAFGDVAAATLGIDVARTRWLLLGGTALLTGVLVSVSGAIGFVGLVLPHAARLVAGSRHRGLLPLAAIGGAVFMIWTDTAARTLFAPRELPVGIVTAIIGAPAFLLILWRFRRLT